ncbi:MAG: protease modulator HflC [Candidatus Adiutrix sp.]|jgi:membrane protease subunit HflC|nr:protease modulator HflC [Candidatus Adiutrix sp.]
MNKASLAIATLMILLIVLANALYTVDQTQSAIVLQFGDPVKTQTEPGLHIKMPFIQNVIYLDNRLMEYDVATTIVYTKDKKNMVVDAYVRWRIVDFLMFYKRFKGDSGFSIVEDAKRRLGDVIIGELKSELGQHNMSEIISESRNTIMQAVNEGSNHKLLAEGGESSGLEVADVRIKRADLPPENQRSVYERMKAERDQQATKYRSEGKMDAQIIRATADRERAELLAKANRASEEIRGRADATAAATYAEAYNLDPEFYAFTRSLESYRAAFKDKSTLVLSPDQMDYLKYFGQESSGK